MYRENFAKANIRFTLSAGADRLCRFDTFFVRFRTNCYFAPAFKIAFTALQRLCAFWYEYLVNKRLCYVISKRSYKHTHTNKDMDKILMIDDDEDILLAAKMFLKKHVKQVVIEQNPKKIPFLLNQDSYDVILLDMNFSEDTTSGKEGFYWLGEILQRDPKAVVIMITAGNGRKGTQRRRYRLCAQALAKRKAAGHTLGSGQAQGLLRGGKPTQKNQQTAC